MTGARGDEELERTDQALLEAARAARAHAHAPYSGFAVGAAVRSRDGRVYPGCNVENVTYGLTICAERVALFSALSDGAEAEALAVAVREDLEAVPCGICRQMLHELAPGTRLVLSQPGGRVRTTTVEALLPPLPFTPDGEPEPGS